MTKKEITKYIKKAVKVAQKEEKLPHFDMHQVLVEFSDREEHGDYSTNIALLIGKKIKKNPMEVTEILVEQLKCVCDGEGRIEAVEPGFINFWLTEKELLDSLQRALQEKSRYGSDHENRTMVIDYSAPNIAKPFGVGHLRSTIIGQAIYNIYEFLGWKCIGDNHLGDWGTQFGKLIVAIKKWWKKNLKELTIAELEKLYVKFHKESEGNEGLLDEARDWFKKLEQGDKEAETVWKICVDVSLKEFDSVYKILGIEIDNALGESFYRDKTKAIIEDAKKRKIAKQSQGALIVPLPDIKVPLMLLKSDGATTYETREMATIKYREEKWNPDLIIWEVGADQTFHFQKSFSAAEILGYGNKDKFIHVAHGLIRWPHGKFSTRKGDTIHLKDILEEAIERAKKILDKSGIIRGIPEKEKQEIAKQVGIGAIKYNDLSRHYSRDIIFDWEKILSLNGNSGPYLQYTAVRCQSVIDKAESNPFLFNENIVGFNQEEMAILRTIYRFPEIVKQAGNSFSPNLICNFAFDLAQKYNIFYEKNSIIKAGNNERRDFRLSLTMATRQILENSLKLLGISIPEKM